MNSRNVEWTHYLYNFIKLAARLAVKISILKFIIEKDNISLDYPLVIMNLIVPYVFTLYIVQKIQLVKEKYAIH